jgi:transcriptional regulator with XRE-family HTH domain
LVEQAKNILADRNMKNRGRYPKNYIFELRDEREMTLRDIEEKTGWSNQTISNLELSKAELSWSKLKKLAEVFECHPLEITEGPSAQIMPKTEEEREVLELYRSMNDRGQDRLRGFLEGIALVDKNDTDE